MNITLLNTADKFKLLFISLLMFLSGLNFLSYAYVWMGVAAIIMLLSSRTDCFDSCFLIVFMLFLSMTFSIVLNSTVDGNKLILKYLLYPLVYLAFYHISRYFIGTENDIEQQNLMLYLIILSFSMGNFTHMVLDVIETDISSINIGRRVINDIWTKGTSPTTIIVGWGALIPSLFLYSYERRKELSLLHILNSSTFVGMIVIGFMISTRLGIFNALASVIIYIYTKIRHHDLVLRKSFFYKIVPIAFFTVYLTYKLIPVILSSNLANRLSNESTPFLNTNGRFEATIYLVQHFSESFFGGGYFTRQYGIKQHNILFQMYDEYGIIPFLVLLVIIVALIKSLYDYSKLAIIRNDSKRFVIVVTVSLIIFLFEEPVLSSNYMITTVLFMLFGYLRGANARILNGLCLEEDKFEE